MLKILCRLNSNEIAFIVAVEEAVVVAAFEQVRGDGLDGAQLQGRLRRDAPAFASWCVKLNGWHDERMEQGCWSR